MAAGAHHCRRDRRAAKPFLMTVMGPIISSSRSSAARVSNRRHRSGIRGYAGDGADASALAGPRGQRAANTALAALT